MNDKTACEVNEAIAEILFDWKWMAYDSIPARGTPGYPKRCRTRRFFPPETLTDTRWQELLERNGVSEATGEEPLQYSYSSSCGPAIVPNYCNDENDCKRMERKLHELQLWEQYRTALALRLKVNRAIDSPRLYFASTRLRCEVAVEVVRTAALEKASG